MLFSNGNSVFSFEIATKKNKSIKVDLSSYLHLAYDPVTEFLFWSEYGVGIGSISLKPGFEHRRVEQLALKNVRSAILNGMDVDICGG